MSATNRIADITDDAWVEIATGPAYVLIELDQPIAPPVLVRVGATLPGTGVLDGFRLTDDRRTLEFESLGASDKLYARSTGGTVSLVVVSAELVKAVLAGADGGAVASRANPVPVLGTVGCYATVSFTPTASAYSANDIMGASGEFAFTFADGTAIPAGSVVRILDSLLRIDATALQASEAGYQLQTYSATQPSAQADNDAWTLASGDLTTYRGAMAIGTPVDLGGALFVRTPYQDFDVRLTTSSLWARLQTLAGFTATAVARQVTLYGIVL